MLIIVNYLQFIKEMQKALLVTFLDANHEYVDATCMIEKSDETLYDTIVKSGVQV